MENCHPAHRHDRARAHPPKINVIRVQPITGPSGDFHHREGSRNFTSEQNVSACSFVTGEPCLSCDSGAAVGGRGRPPHMAHHVRRCLASVQIPVPKTAPTSPERRCRYVRHLLHRRTQNPARIGSRSGSEPLSARGRMATTGRRGHPPHTGQDSSSCCGNHAGSRSYAAGTASR